MDIQYIITTLIAGAGLVLAIINFYNSRFTMENEYFRWATSKEMIDARHFVRNSGCLSVEIDCIPELLNFYNYWGMMVRRRHLSVSIFYSASGINVIEMYEKLQKIIEQERKRNKLYAKDFEWLYNKIKKKYKKLK